MSNDMLKLLQLSGFRGPSINVAEAISARASLHAAQAATAADIVEKTDLADSGTAGKALAQRQESLWRPWPISMASDDLLDQLSLIDLLLPSRGQR